LRDKPDLPLAGTAYVEFGEPSILFADPMLWNVRAEYWARLIPMMQSDA
jgi:hypothetical protein